MVILEGAEMYFTLFKKTIFYYFFVLCIPIAGLAVSLVNKEHIPFSFGVIESILFFFIIAFAFAELTAIYEYSKIRSYLYRDGNPKRFIYESEKLFYKSKSARIKYKIGCSLNMAYISLGEYEKSLELLDLLENLKFKGKNKNNYYFNISHLKLVTFIIKKDYSNAFQYYNKTKPLIDSINVKPQEIEKLKSEFSYIDKRIKYLNNEIEDLDELIKEIDVNENVTFFNVPKILFLAELYLKKGDKEKAKEYLEKVIALGNQTIYVQRAKEMLDENY